MEEPVLELDNIRPSIKKKQATLYSLTHDYLIENFHKFTETNKIKIALGIVSKMAPQQVDGSHTVTKMTTVIKDGQPLEYNLGSPRATNLN